MNNIEKRFPGAKALAMPAQATVNGRVSRRAKEWHRRIIAGISLLGYTLTGFTLIAAVWSLLAAYTADFPGPRTTLRVLYKMLMNPFYVYGPNDMGIGLQLWTSLVRVFLGFTIASLIAIPMGILMGANR